MKLGCSLSFYKSN